MNAGCHPTGFASTKEDFVPRIVTAEQGRTFGYLHYPADSFRPGMSVEAEWGVMSISCQIQKGVGTLSVARKS